MYYIYIYICILKYNEKYNTLTYRTTQNRFSSYVKIYHGIKI